MKWFAALACSAVSFAATTQTWETNGYQDLLRGRIEGLSLTRDGRLIVGPKLDTVFTSDQPQIWSIAQTPDGSLYLGTGNRGRLYKVDAAGKGTVVWTADQPEIFAVTVDASGVIYAGTSPDGKVYRIENGKATEYFAPGARYIWALKTAPDGTLFVATGDQGKIFRVTSAGHGEAYYETGQSHVTCLALDNQGRLLAGSEPNGLLYRISARNKAFVLYDASLPEIRAIVPAPDGSIYAAALGGSVAKRTSAAQSGAGSSTPMVTAPAMSITVTDAQAGLVPAPKPEAPKPVVTTPAVVTTAATTDVTGVEKSALYKINPDNTVETLWSSKEENTYDLVVSNGEITFITDAQGRIYRMDRDRKPALIAQTNEGDATRLLESRAGLIAATGNLARILRLSTGPGPGGWFESPVHDSGTVARWGRLSWRGDGAASSHPQRKLVATGCHLERLVGPHHRRRPIEYHQPQCALHSMARRSGRIGRARQRDRRLSAAEHSAGGAQHQRDSHLDRRLEARIQRVLRQLFDHGDGFGRRFGVRRHAVADVGDAPPGSRSRSPGRPTIRMATS